MRKSNKFPPEVRERAVRMVQEHRGQYRATVAMPPRSETQSCVVYVPGTMKPCCL